MSQQQKQPPKYGLHKASGQAVVHVKGRGIYLGKYGTPASHERYRIFVEQWLAQQAEHEQVDAAAQAESTLARQINAANLRVKRREGRPITIDELIFVYRRHARGYYVKNGQVTRESYLIDEVTGLLGKRHGERSVESLGPVDLDEFREWVIDERDWSRQHLNKQIARIVRMYKWAVRKELCAPAAYQGLAVLGGLKRGRTRARETAGVSCVSDEVVDKTLPKLPPIVADMVRLQRLTGARPGEVCQLRPCDVDRSGPVWIYRPASHKTEHHDKQRVIPVGPQGQAILAPYLQRRPTAYCFSPSESERLRRYKGQSPDDFVSRRLPNPKRKPGDTYDVTAYRKAVQRVCRKLKLPVWSPNQLRHTAATAIRKLYGLEAAQVICGHAQADITQVYAERDLQLALRVASEVG